MRPAFGLLVEFGAPHPHAGTCDYALPQGSRAAALLAVLRVGGLRRTEFAALELEDLDRGAIDCAHVTTAGEILVRIKVLGSYPPPVTAPDFAT